MPCVVLRRDRASLLRSTALQAAALTIFVLPGLLAQTGLAAAQPAPNARPTGGTVVGGAAAISQSSNTTTVTQSTSRAAINWQSFSIGSQQSVDFVQPSSSAMTLNRVTGSDPSAIAGKIQANGGVVLTNPNGVVFYNGSQVNAQNVIVATAGITNQNFMAGKLVFDQPGSPDAKIANAGSITVKDTGLAAFVAPQVANSGVISAKLGHAVLAGAQAATLDMYGDGLVSVDVTKQVTQTPKGATALVTNTGLINADGGQIQLTAQAADGVVTNLVSAGGRIRANSVGGKTGAISITGTGGSIVISGNLSAAGVAAGTTGGTIELNADRAVTVAGTARVNASGAAGGGTVAVGTSLARAQGGSSVTAPTAAATTVAKGARITANATKSGNGGRVTVLAGQTTTMNGLIEAKGGSIAGNGGTVEVSTGGLLTLNGSVDVSAPHGAMGDIYLDPYDLEITDTFSNQTLSPGQPSLAYTTGGTAIGNNATIMPSQIEALTGNVHLQAVDDITVDSPVTLTRVGQAFTLEAGNNLTVNVGANITTVGSIALLAASSGIPGFNTGGALEVFAPVTSTGGSILLQGGAGGLVVAGSVTAPSGATVALTGDTVALLTPTQAGQFGALGGFVAAPNGLVSIEPYTFAHPVELIGSVSTPAANTLSLNTTELGMVTASTLAVGSELTTGPTTTGSAITIGKGSDPVSLSNFGTLILYGGGVTQGAPLSVNTLSGTFSNAALTNSANQIGTLTALLNAGLSVADSIPLTLGNMQDEGPLAITSNSDISLTGVLVGITTAELTTTGNITQTAAARFGSAGTPLGLSGSGGTVSLAGTNYISSIGSFTTTGPFSLADNAALVVGAVSSGAAISITDNGALGLVGNLTAPSVSLSATGAITQTNGVLNTTSLFAQGTTLSFPEANSIANIGLMNATAGGITIDDVAALTIAGSVAATGDISLTTDAGLAINATVSTPGNLNVAVTGGITEGAGGLVIAGALNGSSGASTELVQLNEISSIGSFTSSGGFALNQNGLPITVNGPLADNTVISLTTQGEIFLAGTLSAPTVNLTTTFAPPPLNSGSTPVTAGQLASIDSIVQNGGGITADVLNVSSAGAVNLLPGSDNSISNLGAINAVGLFNLNNQTSVTIAGPVIVSGPTLNAGVGDDYYYQFYVNTPGDLIVSAPISGAVVGLFAGGQLTETAGGVITTGFFQGNAGTISLPQTGNAIGEIELLTSSTNLTLTDGIPLLVNGQIGAGSGGTLLIADNALSFGAAASLSAPGGVIQLAAVNPGDTLAIGAGAATLGAFAAGTLIIGSANAGSVNFDNSTSNLDLTNVGTVALLSGGAVTQTGPGGIFAPLLTGTVAGAVDLVGANEIATLGSFTAGAFTLATSNPIGPLTVAGPLAAGSGQVSSSTGPIVIAGPVSGGLTFATTGTVGGISEAGAGVITSDALGVIVTGSGAAVLTAANTVTGLGSVSVGSGGFTLTDTVGLTVNAGASVAVGGPIVLDLAGSLAVAGTLGSSGSALDLVTTGPITETATGAVIGASLTGSAPSVNLGSSLNAVSTLGAFAATTFFAFADGTGLALAGPLTAPAVTLAVVGPLTENGGSIVTSLLTGSVAGVTTLGGANTIAALGTFTSGDTLALNDVGAVALTGPLTAPSVDLVATGAITESGSGALLTGLLTGNAGSATLTAAGNQVVGLGTFATSGPFSLTDAVPITISGAVSAASGGITIADDSIGFSGGVLSAPGGAIALTSANGSDTLTLTGGGGTVVTGTDLVIGSPTGGPISITGLLDLSGVGAVFLESGGAIVESPTGGLIANLVTGSASATQLGGPNTIANLGSFATTGQFSLNDTINETLTGVIKASTAILVTGATLTEASGAFITAGTLAGSANAALLNGANTIATLGTYTTVNAFQLNDTANLAIGGSVTAGSVSLTTVGAISETTGVITAGTLAAAGASLAFGGNNAIGTVSSLAATGSLLLSDTVPLLIAGAVSGATVNLQNAPVVSESGTGSLSTSTLIASVGTLLLGGSNAIGTLASVLAPGGLAIDDGTALLVNGPVGSAGVTALQAGGPITIAGSLYGATVNLATTGAVTETGAGTINAGTLGGNFASLSLTGANSIGALGSINTPSAITINEATSLDIAGTVTAGSLAVDLGGALTESRGLLVVGTLAGMANDGLTLGGNNRIGTLGSLSAPPGISVNNVGDLAIAGQVSAATINLATTGTLSETTGALSTTVLSGSAAQANLSASTNAIAILNTFTAAGQLALFDSTSVTVAGPVSATIMSLTTPGAIGLGGNISTGGLITNAGGSIVQSAGTLTTIVLTGSAVGKAVFGPDDPGPVANIGTLAGFTVTNGTLSVASNQAMTVTGPLSAATLAVSAPGTLTLAGGSINTTIGTLAVTGGAGSAIDQTGVTTVSGQSSQLSLLLPGQGSISLADLSAPATAVVLGTGSGTATGTVNVGALAVVGQGGNATLTGSVNGNATANAALLSSISPAVSADYTLNGCIIGAVTCGVTVILQQSIQSIQPTQPTQSVPIIESIILPPDSGVSQEPNAFTDADGGARTAFRLSILPGLYSYLFSQDVTDPDIVLPNISDRDY